MAAVPTVFAVQEMQQRPQEYQQVRQDAKEMGCVLGDEEEPADGEKGDQYDVAPRS